MDNSGILILIGTLGGAFIGGLASSVGVWIRERYETKRRTRELIVESAIKEWARLFDFAQSDARTMELMPLANYIAHHALLTENILNEKFDIEKFKQLIKQSNDVTEEIYKNSKEMQGNLKKTVST